MMKYGLYLHVPFCKALCHYCDFAKTANFSAGVSQRYLQRLQEHVQFWLTTPWHGAPKQLSSIFFGGGTPSLFTDEYGSLMALLKPFQMPTCELSLEANPDDISESALNTWKSLGITRLSLGVQTFVEDGLRLLRRVHHGEQAATAINQAAKVFPNVNVDLIYGWPGQDDKSFVSDIHRAVDAGAAHLSLYALTYEGQTPLARAARRGKLNTQTDDTLAQRYETACAALEELGFIHEEISNWSRPQASCAHNWIYWQDDAYLGVGAGAHGYHPQDNGPGIRYAYPRSERAFAGTPIDSEACAGAKDATSLARSLGAQVEQERTSEQWLLEYIGCSLRSQHGVDVQRIFDKTQRSLVPTPLIEEAFSLGLIRLEQQRLRLDRREWFRETAWSVELALAFPERG